jgi:predicted aspartyl protease
MIGRVDSAGRSLLDVELRPSADGRIVLSSVWIDTGFTGELVLPQLLIDELLLTLTGTVSATLADGSRTVLTTYECFIGWFDEIKRLEVVANQGSTALLGVGLLLNRQLTINYRLGHISLE